MTPRKSCLLWPVSYLMGVMHPGVREARESDVERIHQLVRDLASYDGMILCNARGWAPVSRVDKLPLPQNETFTGVIADALSRCPWDEI